MINARLNPRQRSWLKSFLSQYPYYKLRRISEGLGGDRFLLLEGMESLPLPMIPEFAEATAGYQWHRLSVQIRVYGDARKTAIHNVSTVYPHCDIGDRMTDSNREGQLALSIATVLDIPAPINPVIVNWKPKGKARAKLGVQLSLPVSGLEAKLQQFLVE